MYRDTGLWKCEVCELDPKVNPREGMVLIQILYIYLSSGQIWKDSIKESSKYDVL